MSNKKGFTLIELLVVITVIALITTIAVVALNSARRKGRDGKRISDIKQIQTALELYYTGRTQYPVTGLGILVLGEDDNAKALCGNGFTGACDSADLIYMDSIPAAPEPADGSCAIGPNKYKYRSEDGTTYSIYFCLGGKVGEIEGGIKRAIPSGIQSF